MVAVEARKAASQRRIGTGAPSDGAAAGVGSGRVVSLTERRLTDPAAVIAGLPPDRRPLPTVDAYDELLTRRAATVSTTTRSSTANTSTGEVS